VAVLNDERAAAAFLVTFDPQRQQLTLTPVIGYVAAADRSLQLWALAPGGAPRSLGVIGDGSAASLQAAETQLQGVPALAISLEPRGGAPAGSGPTGPVLFKGALLRTAT
jgi:anti-sigma-K factor RskA